jgi:hypothetical protein
MPEYTTGAQAEMVHIHQSTVPESNLCMGTLGLPTKTLWDTGAYYNMMSLSTAKALGLDISKDGQLPTFALADAHTAPCMGRVHTPVRLGPGVYLRTEFLIIAESPYPAILGSHFFHTQGVVINYETSTIRLNVGTNRPQFQFAAGPNIIMPQPVTTLAVRSAVTIPANTEMNVPVEPSGHAHRSTGTWSLVTDAGLHGVHVAKGYTYMEPAGAAGTNYHCRVVNATGMPQTITPDRPLAECTPMDDSDYYISPGEAWDEPADTTPTPACTAQIAPQSTATPSSTEIDAQWAALPHLHGINLDAAEASIDRSLVDRLRLMIIKHHNLWDTSPKEPPKHVEACDFEVSAGAAFSTKTRPMNEPARESLRKITLEQLEKRIIEPSMSRFSSAVVLVPKKGGGIRFAIDYRALNKEIDADAYTLPNVEEALSSLHGCKFFSALDMKEAFWSVPLASRAREYTAFQTPDGLMQYRRMPMGLKTASAVFCRHVDTMLGPMKWTRVLAYIDDLLVFGKTTADEHLTTLDELFTKLAHYGMTLGAKKCIFFAESLQFLGHVVDRDGVRPDQGKVKAITSLQLASGDRPIESTDINSHKQMEQALGLQCVTTGNLSKISQKLKNH